MKPIYSLIILLFLSCAEDKQSTPNIVLIIGDDHGWPYYGFMGNEYVETPVLDQLADSGFVFTNGHVTSSVCRPSLRTLLTGLYPLQFDNYLDSMKSRFKYQDTTLNDLEKGLGLVKFEHSIIRNFHTLSLIHI